MQHCEHSGGKEKGAEGNTGGLVSSSESEPPNGHLPHALTRNGDLDRDTSSVRNELEARTPAIKQQSTRKRSVPTVYVKIFCVSSNVRIRIHIVAYTVKRVCAQALF